MTLDTLPSELLERGEHVRLDVAGAIAIQDTETFLLFLDATDDVVYELSDGEESNAFVWCNEREGATRGDAIAVAREAERRMGLVKR